MTHSVLPLLMATIKTENGPDVEQAVRGLEVMQEKFFPGSTPLQVNALMIDASDALCNGATKALAMEDGQVLSCFFHVLQNVDKHKSKLHKLALQDIKADIWRLHLSRTKESQEALTRATLYKWRAAGELYYSFIYLL
jgi:hypothetical protein